MITGKGKRALTLPMVTMARTQSLGSDADVGRSDVCVVRRRHSRLPPLRYGRG